MTVGLGAQTAPQPANQLPIQSDAPPDSAEFDPWNGGRYRLMPSDVVELTFQYVPEFNQVLTVQPDGYVNLRAVGDLSVQGRTLPQIRKMLFDVYEPILREPVITIVLKEFEKPFFIADGQVKQPGKFDLRGRITLTQALAVAGGLTDAAQASQVILFRRFSAELLEVKEIDVKKMRESRDLSEDPMLRPGDTVFVPKNLMSKIKPFIPVPSIGLYINPLAW
jgi:polysaccharide export outer membrane protein